MEWTGIQNENEFYSAYFFSEGLMSALNERLKKWNEDETKAKEEAQSHELTSIKRSPASALRLACRDLANSLDDLARTKGFTRLQAERAINNKLLDLFGLPTFKSVDGNLMLDPSFPNGDDKTPLPLVGSMYAEGNITDPVLWVLETSSLGHMDPETTDPLQWKVSREQFSSLPKLTAATENDLNEQNWMHFLRKDVFGCDHPPRWVILVAGTSWVLVDRTKWNKNSCLRFDWKEISTRRTQDVLNGCAALLCAESMVGENGRVLLDTIDESAHKQAYGVSEDLKRSLREAIELLGNEASVQLIEKGVAQKDLADILTRECLRYMYRILFLLFVESRKELNYAPVDNPAYATAYSFESLRDLEMIPLMTDEDINGRYIHDSITKLFRFFEKGTGNAETTGTLGNFGAAGFSIFPLRGALFDSSRTPNLNNVVFTNKTLQQVVRLMSLSRGSKGKGRKRTRTGRISYAHLGINQLGAVYEALLSYRGFFAKTDLYEVRPAGSNADEFGTGYFVTAAELAEYNDDEKVYETNRDGENVLKRYPKGSFIYRMTGRDREKSASYYTPEILTQCVVKYALKEYFETVVDKLKTDQEKADKILSLRICEPAMGSAAFLNEAINQLAVRYMEYAQKAKGERLSLEDYGKKLQRVKMYLADNCVFGVDLNPVAVELAEVSLWLNALSNDKFVPWFGLQLHAGNSLVGCRRTVYTPEQLYAGNATDIEPTDIGCKPLKENQIWQFLVPNKSMAEYKDKDVKALFPTEIETLNKHRKAFFRKIRDFDTALMAELSHKAEKLWQSWAKKLAKLRAETTDPYAIYGHNAAPKELTLSYQQKNQLTESLQNGDGREESGEFMRLKMAMDYWCALWFWPIEKAADFPTLDEFLYDMGMLLSSEVLDTAQESKVIQVDLFTTLKPTNVSEDASGRLQVSELKLLCPRIAISDALAQRYRFFHWPLVFADIFMNDPEHVGFDLTFGNPPWRVTEWNSGNVIGDYIPLVIFRDKKAPEIHSYLLETNNHGERLFDYRKDISDAWLKEYEESIGLQLFLGAFANYPETKGSATDLFKFFLPISWRTASIGGVQGFLHPLTNFTETKGKKLRKESYHRLRYIFKFLNEEGIFDGVGHQKRFAICIYRSKQKFVCFNFITNLFHPKTIDTSFESDDNSIAEGIKDSKGKWNHKGQKDRLVTIDGDALESIGLIFSDNLSTPILPDIHSESLLNVMQKFSHITTRIRDLGNNNYCISRMWDETGACEDRTIAEFPLKQTKSPILFKKLILNGPHIHTGNPLFKTPNNPCKSKGDWVPVDLNIISDDFIPRCKYHQQCDDQTFADRQTKCSWDNQSFSNHWKLSYRSLVSIDGERSLQCAIYPPGVSHINNIDSIVIKDKSQLPTLTGLFSSLPEDAYLKLLAKPKLHVSIIESLPISDYGIRNSAVRIRALALNCLTKTYSSFWEENFSEKFQRDSWTQEHVGIQKDFFSRLTHEWHRDCSIRSDLMRRQALLELDVLTAQAMGFNLRELLTMYRFLFRVLADYDRTTWFDQNGRIVSTQNRGMTNCGLPNRKCAQDAEEGITYSKNGYTIDSGGLGFEDVKNMKEGYVEKTFPDISMSEEPVMTTVKYVAPFFQMDREADYRRAWEVFERRFKNQNN